MTTPFKAKIEVAAGENAEFEALLISDGLEPGYSVIVPSLPGCFLRVMIGTKL